MSWTKQAAGGRLPIRPRYAHTATTTAAGIVVFGGASLTGDAFGDVHTLDYSTMPLPRGLLVGLLTNTPTPTPTLTLTLTIMYVDSFEWVRIKTTGESVPARYLHSAVSYCQFVIVFGGTNSTEELFNDVWFLNTDTWEWSKPAVTGTPPPGRFGHSAMLVGSKMIIYGGTGAPGTATILSDTAVFDIGIYTALSKSFAL